MSPLTQRLALYFLVATSGVLLANDERAEIPVSRLWKTFTVRGAGEVAAIVAGIDGTARGDRKHVLTGRERRPLVGRIEPRWLENSGHDELGSGRIQKQSSQRPQPLRSLKQRERRGSEAGSTLLLDD